MRHRQEVAKSGQRDWRQRANASGSRKRGAEHSMPSLQRTVGNQAVQRLLQSRRLQAKLTINQPGDPCEQEADRVAEQVMRMPEPAIQRTCAPCAAGGSPCQKSEAERASVGRRKADASGLGGDHTLPDDVVHELGPGQPLDATTRAFCEPRFDADFGDVRVHTDEQAAQSARAVDALAYTVGRQVVFGQGQYRPDSGAGRVLLAHELAHTIQQRNRTQGSAANEDALEQDADAAVSAAVLDRPVTLSSVAAPSIQFLKVTCGALGKALEVFTDLWSVPNRSILLLQKAPTFMKVAAVINAHYVWWGDSYKIGPSAETDAGGGSIRGPIKANGNCST